MIKWKPTIVTSHDGREFLEVNNTLICSVCGTTQPFNFESAVRNHKGCVRVFYIDTPEEQHSDGCVQKR